MIFYSASRSFLRSSAVTAAASVAVVFSLIGVGLAQTTADPNLKFYTGCFFFDSPARYVGASIIAVNSGTTSGSVTYTTTAGLDCPITGFNALGENVWCNDTRLTGATLTVAGYHQYGLTLNPDASGVRTIWSCDLHNRQQESGQPARCERTQITGTATSVSVSEIPASQITSYMGIIGYTAGLEKRPSVTSGCSGTSSNACPSSRSGLFASATGASSEPGTPSRTNTPGGTATRTSGSSAVPSQAANSSWRVEAHSILSLLPIIVYLYNQPQIL